MTSVTGTAIIRRVHQLVRNGYKPLLGYCPPEDNDLHFRRRSDVAVIAEDGSVWFPTPVALRVARAGSEGTMHSTAFAIFADDAENFDALFPL